MVRTLGFLFLALDDLWFRSIRQTTSVAATSREQDTAQTTDEHSSSVSLVKQRFTSVVMTISQRGRGGGGEGVGKTVKPGTGGGGGFGKELPGKNPDGNFLLLTVNSDGKS